jgi:hypothetical protein
MKRLRQTRFQQLHLIISIFAALVITGICLYLRTGLYTLAVWVTASIAIFYTLGQIIRLYLTNLLRPEQTEDEEILVGEELEANPTDEAGIYSNAYAEFDEDVS